MPAADGFEAAALDIQEGMRVSGLPLNEGAVACLAQLLDTAGQQELAMRIRLAVNTNQPHLSLNRSDLDVIGLLLEARPDELLEGCTDELAELRGAFLASQAA